jgi:nucleotide-binding universal stress UspA family protein
LSTLTVKSERALAIKYQKILVPLDGSELGEAAVAHVMYLALLSGADVMLLCVVPTIENVVGSSQIRIPIDIQWDVLSARAHQYLTGVARRSGWGASKVHVAVDTGSVAEIILAVAEREQMDLIAMSTHGRSGVRRWVLGSVAEKVLHAASTPVLLIRSGSIGGQ